MPRLRLLVLAGVSLIVLGSLAFTGGYACYVRSDGYRDASARKLAEFLDLPAEIGSITPISRRAHQFNDVVVYLPDRRDRALKCRQAVVTSTPTPTEPNAYEIDLRGGGCEISARTWLKGDYRHVLESGLRPSFDPGGPERVRFSEMDVTFRRDAFKLLLHGATGSVNFIDEHHATAEANCRSLNGHAVPDFVSLETRFSPLGEGIRVESAVLRVPRIPVRVLELGELVAARIDSGEFEGSLSYSESDQGRSLTVVGSCFQVDTSEWSAPFVATPWRGTCDELRVDELTLKNRAPQLLRVRGVLRDLHIGDVLALWDLAGVGGTLTLRLASAELTPDGIRRLVASGQCTDLSLDMLTEKLGMGRMTGSARIVIDDLNIEDNHVRSFAAKIVVNDAGPNPGTIEGRLIRELVARTMKIDLPPILPASIDYVRCGVRFDLKDEKLYVLGTHGEREKTILTIRLFGRETPLVFEPAAPIDLRPWLDQARSALLVRLRERIEEFARRALPTTAPSSSEH